MFDVWRDIHPTHVEADPRVFLDREARLTLPAIHAQQGRVQVLNTLALSQALT